MPTVAGLLRAQLVATQENLDDVTAVVYDPLATQSTTTVLYAKYENPFYLKDTTTYYTAANTARLKYWDIFKMEDAESAEKTYTNETDAGDATALTTRAKLRVAQCYSLDFNYIGFEDYYARAVYYGEDEEIEHTRQEVFDGLTEGYASKLLISRNQWNNTVTTEGVDTK